MDAEDFLELPDDSQSPEGGACFLLPPSGRPDIPEDLLHLPSVSSGDLGSPFWLRTFEIFETAVMRLTDFFDTAAVWLVEAFVSAASKWGVVAGSPPEGMPYPDHFTVLNSRSR